MERYSKELDRLQVSEEGKKKLIQMLAEKNGTKEKRRATGAARTVLIVAACMALAVTAAAATPWLREALGNLAPYSQEIEGISAIDRGIRVKVVSGVSDGNSAQVYFEVTDLEGDRLSEFSRMKVELDIPQEADWGTMGWSGANVKYYDETTHTALMWFRLTGGGKPAESLTLNLELSRLLPDMQYKEFPVPPGLIIGAETLDCETLEDDRVVLAPNQTVRTLEQGVVSLSSCGFGSDGRLHFLFSFEDATLNRDHSRLDVDITSEIDREPEYVNNSPEPVWFRRDGVTYRDVCYDIGAEDLSDVTLERFEGWYATGETVDGLWKLEIPLENAPSWEVDMAGTTVINGVEAKTLHLTTMGATLESDPHDSAGTLGFDMTVFGEDGTKLTEGRCDDLLHTGNYVSNHWSFLEPIAPEEVSGIAIGLWYVSIENGVAQPGHWLTELP